MERRRSVLEVMKWVGVQDLLSSVAQVSLLWHELTTCSELWHGLYEDCFHRPCDSHTPQTSFLTDYLQTFSLLFIRNSTATVISIPKFPSPDSFLTISLNFDFGPLDKNAYCLLPGFKALHFGIEKQKNTHLMDFRSGEVTEIAPMYESHLYPGQIHYHHYIYLFGTDTNTAEKLHIPSLHWTLIEDKMKTRHEGYAITASLHGKQVYLVDHVDIERFDMESERFSGALQVKPPESWCYSLGMVYEDCLILLQSATVGRIFLNRPTLSVEVTHCTSLGYGYYTNCPPVWYKRVFFSLHNDFPDIKGVLSFTPSSDLLQEVHSFREFMGK